MPYGPPPAILTEGPPAVKISAMNAAGALTGAELIPLVQGGLNVRSTATAVAGLAGVTPAILVESGAAAKISALPAAGALTGTEQVPINQGGTTVRTTATAIAALAVPAAPANSLQFNNAGVFGGSANATFVSPLTTLHTLTVSTGLLTVTPGQITTGAATNMLLQTSGGTGARVEHLASMVNFINLRGMTTGAEPVVESAGNDTNISLGYQTKGTGQHIFYTTRGTSFQQFKVLHDANSTADIFGASGLGSQNAGLITTGAGASINANITVKNAGILSVWRTTPLSGQPMFQIGNPGATIANFLICTPAITGTNASITAGGTDSNRSISLIPVGTGYVGVFGFSSVNPGIKLFGNNASGTAPDNWFEVTPSTGSNTLTIAAAGSGVNVNITIKPLGSGNVIFEPSSGTTLTQATSAATTVNLYNTVATTVNFAGAATTLTLGATTGTLALRNATITMANATGVSVGADPGGGNLFRIGGALTVNSATMIATKTAFTNGAAANAGTLTNAPAVGDPTKWIPIDDNGTTRYIPAW